MYDYDAPFMFIIDTDSYAGNFERELCAYVTGVWDGETHGGDQARVFKAEVKEETYVSFQRSIDIVLTMDDDCPTCAPQCLEREPTTGIYNSVGIFFQKEPTHALISLMKERAYKFSKEGLIFDELVELKILGFRLFKKIVTIEEIDITA
jgi:hypothetical protein